MKNKKAKKGKHRKQRKQSVESKAKKTRLKAQLRTYWSDKLGEVFLAAAGA